MPENKPEYVVFCHNDIQENNFLQSKTETKIIDFEYSQLNFRGADLASYINESSLNYDFTLPNHYAYEDDRFGDFDRHDCEETRRVNVNLVLTEFLERFYDQYGETHIQNFKETFPTLQDYLD